MNRFIFISLCILSLSCRSFIKSSETKAVPSSKRVCPLQKSNIRYQKGIRVVNTISRPGVSKLEIPFRGSDIIASASNGCVKGICNLALSKNAGFHLKLPVDLGAQANVIFRAVKTEKGCRRSVHYEKSAQPICIGEVLSVDLNFAIGTLKEGDAPVAIDAYCSGGVNCKFSDALSVKAGYDGNARVDLEKPLPKIKANMKCLGTARCNFPFLKATAFIDKEGIEINPNIGINNTDDFVDDNFMKLGVEKDSLIKLKWKDAFLKCKELFCSKNK